jgi:putative oxidoreductase
MRHVIARNCETALRLLTRANGLGPLIVRVVFGYFWLETGWGKLHNLDGAIARFVDWGLPMPTFTAPFSASAELIGGAFLMLGLLTRFTTIAMTINMIVAIAFVAIKNVGSLDDFVELDEVVDILIFVWLFIAGPGRISLDTLIARWFGIATPVTLMSDEAVRR